MRRTLINGVLGWNVDFPGEVVDDPVGNYVCDRRVKRAKCETVECDVAGG
jgi:hypothetical protein